MSESPENREGRYDRRAFWRANYHKQVEQGRMNSEAAWLADGALDHYDKRVADGRL